MVALPLFFLAQELKKVHSLLQTFLMKEVTKTWNSPQNPMIFTEKAKVNNILQCFNT